MKMPILIVDDYSTMLRIIRNLLNQLGFDNIHEASNGQDALEKIKSIHPAPKLIISDWNMEPICGLDLLKTIRANDNYKNIPFIMVTAESKAENVMAAKQAGASNYIVKPFNAATLKQKLNSVLGEF
ncbi:MAG: response regulator [Candidatus Jidaibacter sp.]|nr:response regulator [Candidatus Jidaibacter sp.]